jgi:hypothetical protein
MPRFVLLYHRCPTNYVRSSHWDLMLEQGDMLRTWALARLPKAWQAAHSWTQLSTTDCPPLAVENDVEAVELADHRREYLDYEGELSGDRGSVTRVAEGTYRAWRESADCIECEIDGAPLAGSCMLGRVNGSDRWTLSCGESNSTAS